jgi:AbrB family looped-hinge helix DNA binding protein
MNKAILSNNYQVIIPKEIWEKIGLKAGVSFEVITYANRIELVPIKPINELKGILKGIDTNIIRDEDRI